jgi:STE24 endopeptidase
LITLPIDYYSSYILLHKVGLSNESFGGWIVDRMKGWILSILLGGVVAGAFVFILSEWPEDWWWVTAILGILLGALLALLAPVLLAPLFFKFEPLSDLVLKERLEALLKRTGAQVRGGVWKMDMSRRTKAANAALVGWGPSRRVVLSDTLLEYSPDEIEAILAHELAHHLGHHIRLLMIGRGFILAVGLFLAQWILEIPLAYQWTGIPPLAPGSIEMIAAVWIVLSIWGAVISPVILAISRHLEFGCDQFAVSHATHPESMATALEKLCRKNLADPSPPRWVVTLFHSHPPIQDRVERVLHGVGVQD